MPILPKAPKAPEKVKPLKRLNVTTAPAAEEEGEETKVIELKLEGDAVAQYNDACAQIKAWEKEKAERRPNVLNAALHKLFTHNCAAPNAAVKTVRVVDSSGENGAGATCNVTLCDTYSNAQLVLKELTPKLVRLGKTDPNVFVEEKLLISFNAQAFYDEQGNLRQDYYEAVLKTLQNLAVEHGAKCPMSSTTVVSPKKDFADKRWTEFRADQQAAVSAVFPATITLKPIAPTQAAS